MHWGGQEKLTPTKGRDSIAIKRCFVLDTLLHLCHSLREAKKLKKSAQMDVGSVCYPGDLSGTK